MYNESRSWIKSFIIVLAILIMVGLIINQEQRIARIKDETSSIGEAFNEPEQIMYYFTTSFDNYKPQWFLKVVGTDISRCFIDGRLRIDLNGEIYWIRLEK